MKGLDAARATSTAKTMLKSTTFPNARSASLRLPSPKRSAASAFPPLPTSIANAMNTMSMGLATVMADKPTSPMALPRKTELTMA